MPHLGAHESVAGGLHLAFEKITEVGGQSLQIFTRNQRQWQPKDLTEAEIKNPPPKEVVLSLPLKGDENASCPQRGRGVIPGFN